MTGLVRSEWCLAKEAMVIPTNWSQSGCVHIFPNYSPLRFLVADARNLIAEKAVMDKFEWLIFLDHDVLFPKDLLVKFNEYMLEEKVPIVGGLYFTKSVPAEPLIYRGRGNGYFRKWRLGEKVWVDGMGLGCHLISVKLLTRMYEEAEVYSLETGLKTRRIFHSPTGNITDPETGYELKFSGTEDLPWYDKVKNEGYFKKSGWKEYQGKQFPFLCDTTIFCQHINENGERFPSLGEEKKFK